MADLHERIASDEYWQGSQRMPRVPILPYGEALLNNSVSSFGIGNSPLKRVKRLFLRAAEEGFEYRQAEEGQQLSTLLDDDSLVRIVEDHRKQLDRFGQFMFGAKQSDPMTFENMGMTMLAHTLYASKLVRRVVEQDGPRPYLVERQVSYLVATSLGGIAAGSSSYELNMPSNVATGIYLPSSIEVGTPYDRSKGKNNNNIKIVKASVLIPTPKDKFRSGKLVKQN
jgi:hypothetical protein